MRNNTDPVLVAGLHQHSWLVNISYSIFLRIRIPKSETDLLFCIYVTPQ